MHACFVFWILLESLVSRAVSHTQLVGALLRSHFARHCRLHPYLQLFHAFFNGFLVLSIFWMDEINVSQFLSIIELWFFDGPFMLFPVLSGFRR